MKKTFIGLVAGLSLLLFASPVSAFFSVAADLPLQYNFSEGEAADDVSGLKVSVSLPFFVGFGLEQYTATVDSTGLKREVEFSIFDLYVNLPIPAVIIGIGVGVGTASVTDTPETTGQSLSDAALSQYFVTLGYPIFPLFDIHVGYHVISGTSDVKVNGIKTSELVLDGNMLSVGVAVGF